MPVCILCWTSCNGSIIIAKKKSGKNSLLLNIWKSNRKKNAELFMK